MNLSDWSRDLALLHKSKAKFHFEIGDYMNSGIKAFGSEEMLRGAEADFAFTFHAQLLPDAARLVAALYPPSLRFANAELFNVYEATAALSLRRG